jgi:hypothetical protein
LIAARTLIRSSWLAAFLAVVAALLAAPAGAAKPCSKQVIDDWFDNGRVDQIYRAQCYRDAVKSLPTDVRDYSSAKDDILRALSFALRGESDPGKNGTTDPTATETTPTTPSTTPTESTPTSTKAKPKPTPGPTETTPASTVDEMTNAAEVADSSSSSSVPIPLLVLGGLAVLLFAAGAAGYLTRRFRANGPDDGPPAGA